MSKTAFDAPRSNLYQMLPEELEIITDKEDPLYDPRVELPVEENLILNIMYHGILENVIATKRGDKAIVVAGRQRVKAALEANKRLKAQGKELVRVPTVFRRGDEIAQVGVMISENEIRQSDGILGKADKCRKFLDMGRTEAEAATVFGVTIQTIKNWLEIISLTPSVKKAVDNGMISATAAAKLSGLAPAEQKQAAEELLESAAKSGKKRVSVGKAAAKVGKKRSMRSKKEIMDVVEVANDPWVRGVLKWVLGECEDIGPDKE